MARIFISYRRDDSGGWESRLYDRLSQHFGRDAVGDCRVGLSPTLGIRKIKNL
jgi:hypothetical protein